MVAAMVVPPPLPLLPSPPPQLRLAAEMVAAMVVPPPLPLLPLLPSPPPQLHTISEQSWMHDQLFRDDALSLVLYLKEN